MRGKLLPEAWTATVSFSLPAGPATVVGILKAGAPRFSARLLPLDHPASFAGYRFAKTSLWVMPRIGQGEDALAGWFPYQLPAGRYRLLMRETGGGASGGSYNLVVAGVK